MAGSIRVYVFGDQTYDITGALSKILQADNDPVLTMFLERALVALKREVERLPQWQQSECPRFSRLADLIPEWQASTLNPALGQALTCMCQLGLFLLSVQTC